MKTTLKSSMFEYYDQRAGEYDELYTLGTAPRTTLDPAVYRGEVEMLAQLVSSELSGVLLDAPSGAGYWLLSYAGNCSSMTLVDQSTSMLDESRAKARSMGVQDRVRLIQADLLEFEFPLKTYDAVLVGFFLGHLTRSETQTFFGKLRTAMKPDGKVLILESVWSEARRQRAKEGKQQRSLKDGRRFDIYKKYFVPDDFDAMGREHELALDVRHEGQAYIAASGRFDPGIQSE